MGLKVNLLIAAVEVRQAVYALPLAECPYGLLYAFPWFQTVVK